MSFQPGKNQLFSLDDETGTLRNISVYVTSVSASLSLASEEAQTLGDNSIERCITLADSQFTVEGFYDKTADSMYDVASEAYEALRDGTITSLSYSYQPQGATTGDPVISGECVISNVTPTGEVGGLLTLSLTLDGTGDATLGVNP